MHVLFTVIIIKIWEIMFVLISLSDSLLDSFKERERERERER